MGSMLAGQLLQPSMVPKNFVQPVTVATRVSANSVASSPAPEVKKYVGLADRLRKYMGAGCNLTEAARAAGCDVSYVSQLYDDPEFKSQVEEMRNAVTTRRVQIDDDYEATEVELSKRLRDRAPLLTNVDQILRVLKFTNESKKKIQTVLKPDEGTTKIVPLMLPIFVQQNFRVNPNNEVIEVGGRVLQTIDSKQLESIAARMLAQTGIEDEAPFISLGECSEL